ncbi:MAG: hypothetical protein ACOYM3_07370 [Terrimicrobiaceae bacterium]
MRNPLPVLSLVAFLGTVFCVTPLRAGGNLLPDPSFEHTQPVDKFGKVFPEWDGWIFAEPGKFEASGISHSGATSCEMIAGRGGKIRIFSTKLDVPPGRYRLTAYLRGLDVIPGAYGATADFSDGLSEKFPMLKDLSGTFGWRPFTYVFDRPEGKPDAKVRIYFGLITAGRMWVDDVSLEAVGKDVALTPTPVIGAEEKPITPPAGLNAATAVRCPSCGYRNLPAATECYACGSEISAPAGSAAGVPPVFVFADFEGGAIQPFSSGALETAKPIAGNASIRLEKDKDYLALSKPLDWSDYDYVLFDVFNPSDDPKKIYIEIQDAESKGYWTRVNFFNLAPPGKSTVRFPTRLYVGEKSRPGRPLLRAKVTKFVVGLQNPGPLIFDNFRLETLDTSKHVFPELTAFDFGPADGPVMEGFRPESGTMYSEGRGYGWLPGAKFWRDQNALQPDALIQDFITPEKATFRVNAPNGKYHVVLNLDSPGGYWGEAQRYKSRSVKANGVTVVEDTVDYDGFVKDYLADADSEDLPGLDTFGRYVQAMQKVQSFDVDVKDGTLDLEFTGLNWANCLTHVVIYPVAKQKEGEEFLAWVEKQRRAQFEDYFKQIEPKRTGEKAPAGGFRLFHRSPMRIVNAFDGPAADDKDVTGGLSADVAGGEENPVTFSLQPGSELGPVTIELSAFATKSGEKLPEGSITPGWLDYRISRVTMEGSVYSVGPRYWHPVPAPASPGVTRTFWLRVTVPAGTLAGDYAGEVTVKPEKGSPQKFPLTVRVLPFDLPPVKNLAVGPWGSGIAIPWVEGDPAASEWNLKNFSQSLDALKKYGFTSFSGRPNVRAVLDGGKITLDTTTADSEMKIIREKGFDRLISTYGIRTIGYNLYLGPNQKDADHAGVATPQDLANKMFQEIDDHAKANNWVPVAYNLCDEPIGAQIPVAVGTAKIHREAAKGLERTTFMGATSMTGNDPKDSHYELVQTLPMPALTLFDEDSLGVIKGAGNAFAYYNGGSRWTFGFYMKMLKDRHALALRLNWHFNVAVGNPYYALDCREDDYCWFNTNVRGDMVPSLSFLQEMVPGLNDYRRLLELDSQLALAKKALAGSPPDAAKKTLEAAIAGGEKITAKVDALRAGPDGSKPPADVEAERTELTAAILALMEARTK